MEEIAVSIVKKENTFLLVKRKQKEGNLQWQFPAGKIEEDEKDYNASVREAFEETGVVCEPIDKLGERLHPDTLVKIYYWLNLYVSGEAYVKAENEIDEVRWCTADEVLDLVTSDIYPNIRELLDRS